MHGYRNLTKTEIEGLQPYVVDLFGIDEVTKAALPESLNHWAVAEFEAMCHVRLWDHEGRMWRKVGGDHSNGRPRKDGLKNVTERCVRLLVCNSKIDEALFIDHLDHTKPCTQQWNTRTQD